MRLRRDVRGLPVTAKSSGRSGPGHLSSQFDAVRVGTPRFGRQRDNPEVGITGRQYVTVDAHVTDDRMLDDLLVLRVFADRSGLPHPDEFGVPPEQPLDQGTQTRVSGITGAGTTQVRNDRFPSAVTT